MDLKLTSNPIPNREFTRNNRQHSHNHSPASRNDVTKFSSPGPVLSLALCKDCESSGFCRYKAELAKKAVPLRSNHIVGGSVNAGGFADRRPSSDRNNWRQKPKATRTSFPSQSSDIENVLNFMVPSSSSSSSNVMISNSSNNFSPHPELKLRHKDCPFHLQKSIGLAQTDTLCLFYFYLTLTFLLF